MMIPSLLFPFLGDPLVLDIASMLSAMAAGRLDDVGFDPLDSSDFFGYGMFLSPRKISLVSGS